MTNTKQCVMLVCALSGGSWGLPAWAYQEGAVVLDSQRGAMGGPSATIYQTTPRKAPQSPATPSQPATFPNGQSAALAPVIVVQPSLRPHNSYQTPQTSGLRAPGY